MRFGDLLKLSTRMFKARTSRTLLTILGMGVGIGAILFLVSLGYGLQRTLLEKITTTDSLLTLDVTEGKVESNGLNNETLSEFKELEGVDEVSPISQIKAQGHLEGVSSDMVVYAISPSFFRLSGTKLEQGIFPTNLNKEEIVVTPSVAKVFGKSPEEIIGKEIAFTFFVSKEGQTEQNLQGRLEKYESEKNYKIVGVTEGEGEDSLAYINSESLGFGINSFSQFKVKCSSNEVMKVVREKILSMGFLVSSLSDTVDQANKIFKVIQFILMLFGIIALVVSAIGMFNTMTIALLERTGEIGIMKSIGASDGSISAMFIMESAIMGFLGGVCGVLIGFIEGIVFNGLVNLIATHMGGEKVSLFYSPFWFVMLIVVFAAFVGMLTGFTPARRASKIDPLDALRYK